jgi:hypothetical protein
MSLLTTLADAQALINAVKTIANALDGTRSVVITVSNRTSRTLERVSQQHVHGNFAELPSVVIPPGAADVFSSRDTGFATGTEGDLQYRAGELRYRIHWKNPFVGGNACHAGLGGRDSSRFRTTYLCGTGNEKAPIEFDLFEEPSAGWGADFEAGFEAAGAQGIATFGGVPHLVFQRAGTHHLQWSSFDESSWSWRAPRDVPGQTSQTRPGLAELGGRLHMVHLGDSSEHLWWSTFTGEWTPNVRIPDQTSEHAPALAAYRDRLHMIHTGGSSSDLWWSTCDGTRWTPNTRIAGAHASSTPAMAVLGDRLFVAYQSAATTKTYLRTFDGMAWSGSTELHGIESNGPPALAVHRGKLHLVRKVYFGFHWSVFDGQSWSSSQRIGIHTSKDAPAITAFADRLMLTHIGESSDRVWWSEYSEP